MELSLRKRKEMDQSTCCREEMQEGKERATALVLWNERAEGEAEEEAEKVSKRV